MRSIEWWHGIAHDLECGGVVLKKKWGTPEARLTNSRPDVGRSWTKFIQITLKHGKITQGALIIKKFTACR